MIDIVNKRANEQPDKIFIYYNNASITYQEFNYMVLNLIDYMNEIDGHYIGIQINHKIKLLVLIIAINRLKKIPVLYPDIPNTKDYIKATNIPIAFTDTNIIISKKQNSNSRNFDYDKNATQLVMFTSGTTGRPKACELTYHNIYESACMWDKIINFDSNDIYLNHMSLTHVSGICVFYRALYLDFMMVVDNFDLKNYIENIKEYKITLISMVPSMLQMIMDTKSNLQVLKKMKAIIIGGSPINNNLARSIKKYKLPVYMSYGMTESSSGVAGYWINNSSIYKMHPGVNISVDKTKFSIESPTIMKKYMYGKDTNNIIESPDICTIYKDGFFQIEGRGDKTAISGGENISIPYIKKHIEEYPEIKKCILEIVQDRQWGEILHANIQCNKKITLEILLDKLKKDLPKYMIPKKITIQ